MKYPERKWTIYVIHHSHTDIGYTERQEKIEQFHIDFIHQALSILASIESGERKDWAGFKWTCETFWAVERFWEQASEETREQFVRAVQSGAIGLSANYLNMTELIDGSLLRNMIAKSIRFAESHDIKVDSAMTADINGYSWGFAQELADAGVEHLLSCVHPHHGMFPLWKKQTPFWWETPKGNRLLVWNGDHYNLGNDFGFAPKATHSYVILDEFPNETNRENHWEVLEKRVFRYLSQLEAEKFPYSFVPVAVSGLMTDNAPPNAGIIPLLQEWNEKHGDLVELKMVTLSEFFTIFKPHADSIPVYKGDWPDWWSDGVASTAISTQVFRQAKRTLRLVKQLDPEHQVNSPDKIEEIEYQLIQYAEHTWGHSHSVSEPWNPHVQSLRVRKDAYAANASRLTSVALDRILRHRGEAELYPDRPFTYKVINPTAEPVEDVAFLHIDYWECPVFKHGMEVVEIETGSVVPHQIKAISRGWQIIIQVKLNAGEEQSYMLRPAVIESHITTINADLIGSDGVRDVVPFHPIDNPEKIRISEHKISTPYVHISWKAGEGITSWIDLTTGIDLLQESEHAPFTPVYEVTPVQNEAEIMSVRRGMGRNRKGFNVQRSVGRLVRIKTGEQGEMYGTIELQYEVAGMSYYSVFVTAYANMPRVDVAVRLHKDSVWSPENVYVSLPFRASEDEDEQLWLEKAGCMIRPGEDQLPGTCIDFYCIQEGLAFVSPQAGLALATPDAPLIQLGSIEHQARHLHQQSAKGKEPGHLYAWVLNNFWETNFQATVGGFYEFRYLLQWGNDLADANAAIGRCHQMNNGIVAFRTSSK
ncbi:MULTISPECIES: glycoside hydrolase [Paenibacillus]|uniref:Glycoside hydrolase family 38 N-terminal domain-containing protein n=1 Tax=Paenibacillus albilobatus TaxID=2716884 RepID=A0A920CAM6_9BACL|nr:MULTISPECIES: glycoside hydrolase [Paenibacillus]GIO29592.1 hypothetical protein J2TS6_07330 [Paenibacillus albilobatus]